MKIYFASSIRGVNFREDYRKTWLTELSKIGTVVNVSGYDESADDDATIFERDIKWIAESDVLVAEISSPSLGVGYEISYAEHMNKPVICFYMEDINISAMINGNTIIKKIPYNIKKIKNTELLKEVQNTINK